MRELILILAALVVTSASPVVYADLYHDFVFVPTDADFAKGTMTRDIYNKSHPSAAKRWHEAWDAEGMKNDNVSYAGIRKTSTRPADMKLHASASTPATVADK